MRHGGSLSVPEHTGFILCPDLCSLTYRFCPMCRWCSTLQIIQRFSVANPAHCRELTTCHQNERWQHNSCRSMARTCETAHEYHPPVLEKINNLKKKGISVLTGDGPKTVRACLVMSVSVFDLPAKCAATNMVQYNGYNSCTYYFLHRHIFPPVSTSNTLKSVWRSQCVE